MAFLNPLALFGLFAAGIPILIHLFNFRKPRRVDFSSLTFLRELQRSTMRRVRIKQWLLLLLRTLVIACLVLAFARPTIEGSVVGGLAPRSQKSVAIIIDNSLSMSARNEYGDYFTQAREAARALIETLNSGDEVLVSGTAPPFRNVSTTNHASAIELIDEMRLSSLAGDPRLVVVAAADVLADALHPNKEIFVISDYQRSVVTEPLSAIIDPDIHIALLPVQGPIGDNIAIEDARISSQIIEVGQPVQLEATIRNYSAQARNGYTVSVFLNGERVAQQVMDLDGRSTRSMRFAVTPREAGWLDGLVQGEEDIFPFDDTRHFTLHIPEIRDILLVQGRELTADYVSLVISPSESRTRARVPFSVTRIGEDELSTARFAAFDGVILVGLEDLSSGEVATLSDYIEHGGGVLLFAGTNAGSQGHADFLRRIGGGRISGFAAGSEASAVVASIDRFETEHPLFAGVFDTDDPNRLRMEHPDIYQAAIYVPGSGNEQTLAWMSDGNPFLQEIEHGRGRLLLLTVLPDPTWSDLPKRGLFVPLVYRSLYSLSSGDSGDLEELVLGQARSLRIPVAEPEGQLRMVSKEGLEIVPEQRDQFQSVLLIVPDDLEEAGTYSVFTGDVLVRKLAVNLSSQESDLNLLDTSEAVDVIEQSLSVEPVVFEGVSNVETLVARVSASRFGIEIWNVFLTLALIFLVVEMLVAMRWRSEIAE